MLDRFLSRIGLPAVGKRLVRRGALLLSGVTLALVALVPASASAARPTAKHTVGFDKYSVMIDGQRKFIWSGEFHPFRLPSPSLWRDVLEKMKADGYNAVSMYFDWGYHSAAPGDYDFSGVRDMDRALAVAASVGLYVIARPGP